MKVLTKFSRLNKSRQKCRILQNGSRDQLKRDRREQDSFILRRMLVGLSPLISCFVLDSQFPKELEFALQIVRIDMKLANEDVTMLAFTSEEITAPFLLPEMVT